MIFFILLIVVIITLVIKYYHYSHHHHSYLNSEQFNQYYCQSFASATNEDDESCSLSTIHMLNKCESTDKYHIKSNADYISIHNYIKDFLCQSNDYINKPGPVCPFVPLALKQQSIYFFIANDHYNNKERLIEMIQQCKYDFLFKLKTHGAHLNKLVYKCLIMMIRSPDIPHNLIDEIQTELKPNFIIQHGLMFGEFHESSNSNAIHNDNFYPLRTKVPLLVIRYMVANDIIFLNQKEKYSVEIRRNMIKKYLNLYHSGLLYHSKPSHLQTANEILKELSSSSED